ncbi:MAG: NADH-quinone oxidoreductase subunit NuoB [Thermotogae bacterium]|jgi:NADH-quinone oxidoreductase subunit B|nr:NADH-quinone oxidoreductase subunit NuoB [Thermotogota bacterium]MCL5033424.1 NADH-quinone oxidoreductase subunit NuoB [Thermotogota bacterium]
MSEWTEIVDYFRGRSMWMLHYCTGCGAIELPPTMTSRWDMERFGITPMATPRQADILLITGYLAIKTLKRVIYTYEQMQAPKWVLGFGSCTINGGIYWDSYNVIERLDKYIPVDIYIAGCMPRPEAILDAFVKLKEMVQMGEAKGYEKYVKNYDWYKANQDKVLKRTSPVLKEIEKVTKIG